MEIDLLNSASSEDEMEMIMTMPLDKLAYFCSPHDYVGDQISPLQQLPGGSSNSSFRTGPQMNDNSPTFMNLPSTISFGGVAAPAVDEDELQGQHFMSTGKWRGAASDHQFSGTGVFPTQSQKQNSMAAMREMIFRIAAMQPIHIDPESVKPPKRRNVKISKDPQSVAARHRRERISERIRILQRLVPGGTKMDTASMLDEAIHYVKFLKSQVQSLERAATTSRPTGLGFPVAVSSGSYLSLAKDNYHPALHQSVQQYSDAN